MDGWVAGWTDGWTDGHGAGRGKGQTPHWATVCLCVCYPEYWKTCEENIVKFLETCCSLHFSLLLYNCYLFHIHFFFQNLSEQKGTGCATQPEFSGQLRLRQVGESVSVRAQWAVSWLTNYQKIFSFFASYFSAPCVLIWFLKKQPRFSVILVSQEVIHGLV